MVDVAVVKYIDKYITIPVTVFTTDILSLPTTRTVTRLLTTRYITELRTRLHTIYITRTKRIIVTKPVKIIVSHIATRILRTVIRGRARPDMPERVLAVVSKENSPALIKVAVPQPRRIEIQPPPRSFEKTLLV